MRITRNQLQRVKEAIARHFGATAEVWVFGSRIDNQRKGGDFDFYVETDLSSPEEVVARKIKVLAELHATSDFEGEKIDLVVNSAVPGPELPIYAKAKEQGERL